MIFVTLGNVPHPFIRLAEKVDEIAGKEQEEFLVQYGHTPFTFKHARSVKFLDYSEMQRIMAQATVVVSHGGCGTLFEALKMGKKIVAVPRQEREHNHSQRELVEALEHEGCLLAVYDIAELEFKIKVAGEFIPKRMLSGNAAKLINDFISKEFPGH